MPHKDTNPASVDTKNAVSAKAGTGVLNEAIMDLALDCRDYYGDNDLAADVLRSKYLAPNEKGPMHMWNRIARALASVENDQEYWYNRFLELLFDFKFVPGGRVMHGAGREDATPPPDTLQLLRHPDRGRQPRGHLPLHHGIGDGVPDRRRRGHRSLHPPPRRARRSTPRSTIRPAPRRS